MPQLSFHCYFIKNSSAKKNKNSIVSTMGIGALYLYLHFRPWCIVNIFVVQVHAYMRNFEDGMLIVVESSAIPPYVHMVYRSPIGFEPFSHGRKYRWGNNSPQYSADTVDFISRVHMD